MKREQIAQRVDGHVDLQVLLAFPTVIAGTLTPRERGAQRSTFNYRSARLDLAALREGQACGKNPFNTGWIKIASKSITAFRVFRPDLVNAIKSQSGPDIKTQLKYRGMRGIGLYPFVAVASQRMRWPPK